MIRETSVKTYLEIKENGLLSKRRFQVYQYLFDHGPCFARQIHKALSMQGTNSSSFVSRLSELRDAGVVKEVGETIDPETGMSVILWDVTQELPVKVERKETMSQKYKKLHMVMTEVYKNCRDARVIIDAHYKRERTSVNRLAPAPSNQQHESLDRIS